MKPPTLCPGCRESVAGAKAAISGHRRAKTVAEIALSLSKQCPRCIALTKEPK